MFAGNAGDLLPYGAGIALPIAASGVIIGFRSWSQKINRGSISNEDIDHELEQATGISNKGSM